MANSSMTGKKSGEHNSTDKDTPAAESLEDFCAGGGAGLPPFTHARRHDPAADRSLALLTDLGVELAEGGFAGGAFFMVGAHPMGFRGFAGVWGPKSGQAVPL